MIRTLGLSAESIDPGICAVFAGVGLLRGEYIQRRLRKSTAMPEARDWMYDYLVRIAGYFHPSPVWYRTSDLELAETPMLEGAPPLDDDVRVLGVRGIRQSMLNEDAFQLELETFARALKEAPNLRLMFPFVAEAGELHWALARARQADIGCATGCMLEIPSAVVEVDAFLSLGVERVMIGLNDLTSLMMGDSRDSRRYPLMSDAIVWACERVVQAARPRGVTVALGGYLDRATATRAESLGVDECVINYPNVPDILGLAPESLPELNLVSDIKRHRSPIVRQIFAKHG